MSITARLARLERLVKPQLTVRYIKDETEITNEPHTVWVIVKY